MMKYIITESDVINEDGEMYRGYGFCAFEDGCESSMPVYRVDDLSVDRDDVIKLVKLLSENDVHPVHLPEIVDDFLA